VAATVIGSGITIEGEVSSDDEVVVAGVVRGKLSVEGSVTVESDGVVEADIGARTVAIGGNVIKGNVDMDG
jgi:cytoskeletal protein CcmA (bactofilin family)